MQGFFASVGPDFLNTNAAPIPCHPIVAPILNHHSTGRQLTKSIAKRTQC